MTTTRSDRWRALASRQAGMLARRQLLALGLGHHYLDAQVAAERWQQVSDVVVATVTGVLTRQQLMWAGVLHAGPGSAVGGLTALEVHGLTSWPRVEVTVLLAKSHGVEPVEGVEFVQTRRPIGRHTATVGELPVWRTEPAALLVAGYERSQRTAFGLLAAVVQQRLSTPERLEHAIDQMHPLRMAKPFRHYLHDLAGGVQSLAEHDVKRMCRTFGLPLPVRQTRRRDSTGTWRYTDCEWRTAGGRPVVLEIDGSFHYEVAHWEADMGRERDLVVSNAIVLRCTALEVREFPEPVAGSLLALGVVGAPTRSSAPGAPPASPGADDPGTPPEAEEPGEQQEDWSRSSA